MAHFNAKDFNYVKSFIENEYSDKLEIKYTLLSNEYKNNSTPLKIVDEDGFLFSSNFGAIMAGYKVKSYPRKYYKNNMYSLYNMKHYIKINGIDCELISTEYIDTNKSKYEFLCSCGNHFKTSWNEFIIEKQQCNKCGRKNTANQLKHDDDFIKNYFNSYGCKMIGNYKDCHTEIDAICKCGNNFTTTFTYFQKMKYKCCPKCTIVESGYRQSQIEDSYNDICNYQKTYGNTVLTKLEDYFGMKTMIDIMCKCGNTFNIVAFVGKKQHMCQECSKIFSANKRRTSVDDIECAIQECSKYSNKTFEWISGEHKNRFSKITIQDENGYKYSTTVSSFTNGHRTNFKEFHQNNPYTIENIKLWLSKNADGYTLLSDTYVSAKDYLMFKCPEGHIFKMNWDNFKQGQRCPECKLSKGARMVLYHLRNIGENFEIEYWFKDCRGNRKPLPFDFILFNEDYSIKCTIEFDGELHYNPPRFSKDNNKNIKVFKRTQKYDAIKTKYCIDNNIPLLRIPYWERDNGTVENVIDDFLNQLDSNISQSP